MGPDTATGDDCRELIIRPIKQGGWLQRFISRTVTLPVSIHHKDRVGGYPFRIPVVLAPGLLWSVVAVLSLLGTVIPVVQKALSMSPLPLSGLHWSIVIAGFLGLAWLGACKAYDLHQLRRTARLLRQDPELAG
jgi:hypothetical protein